MKTLINKEIPRRVADILSFLAFAILFVAIQSCTDESEPVNFDYQTLYPNAQLSMTLADYYEDGSNDLTVEIYDPVDNRDELRPLILLTHGGGLVKRTQVDQIKSLAQNLAKRGYVTGYFTYSTLGQTPAGWVRSVVDAKVVVKYFKKHAQKFRIDPYNIFTGGWSNGAHTSLNAAHMSLDDLEQLNQPYLKQLLVPEVEKQGFEGKTHMDYSPDVKGTLLMLPYTKDVNILDENGPAVMMVASQKQQFTGGQILWDTVYEAGTYTYGPDLMEKRLLEVGYKEGQDCELIVVPEDCCGDMHPNESIMEAILTSESYKNDIAGFFSNNLN